MMIPSLPMTKNSMKNAFFVAILCLAGCGDRGGSSGFGPASEPSAHDAPVIWGLSAKERFRFEPVSPATGSQKSESADASSLRLAFDLPQGWTELPATANRMANFRIGGEEGAECYLSLLGGDGGGLVANVNRWRQQLSLEPLDEAAVEALPRVSLFQRQAVLLECSGTWKGMDGSRSDADWGLIGLLLVNPQASAFLKMTGPGAVVTAEKERFLALSRTMRFENAPAEPAPPAPQPDDSLPMGSAQGLSWTVPEGWKQGPAKPMRAANLIPREGLECYLAVLDGDGGGAMANINRWRQQMGRGGLSPAEIEALARVEVLGRQAHVVEIEGDGENAGKKMLGLVAEASGRAIFVKMTGPSQAVAHEREKFLAFAASIREAP